MNAAPQHAHLVGIAGVGMNALAQALCGAGWNVSGSDRYEDQGQDLEVIRKLKAGGVRFHPQDGSGIGADTRAVVVSSAIEKDNPDLLAAERFMVPVVHRATMLADLMTGREVVAIAGTSGKTTVTGMTGWILEQMGADPTVVNGGILVNWADGSRIGNVRTGGGRLCVVEVDESDKSLLRFSPDWAIITNMSADHFGIEETHALFDEFRSRVRRECIVGWETEIPQALPELSREGARFRYRGLQFELPVLGAHNVENALHAAMLCERMGYPLEAVRDALRLFKGVQRRLERVGEARGVTVIDEYAHNPAKIAAAWRAAAPHYRRVLGFWRPHGFKPLSMMALDLQSVFGELCHAHDRLWLMPVYYAGGSVTRQMDSDELSRKLASQGCPVGWVRTYEELMEAVLHEAREGDVVLCMGARDPGIPRFARELTARLRTTQGAV